MCSTYSLSAIFLMSIPFFFVEPTMPAPSDTPFITTSRRSVVKGGAALLGVSALGLASTSGQAQAPLVRMDIVNFAQDAARLARFEGAV